MRLASAATRQAGFLLPSRGGFTLLELITVVTILGLALAEGLPAARRIMDGMAVAGAREAVVGVFHNARAEAVARGGARIVLRASTTVVELWSGGALRSSLDLTEDLGVTMTLSAGADLREVEYDPLGLGRVASLTIVFTRGSAESGLVVSSLGRVTRR